MSDTASITGVESPPWDGPLLQLVPDPAEQRSEQPSEPVDGAGVPGDEPLEVHITYHPISDVMLESYAYYVFDANGRALASEHADGIAMDEPHRRHLVSLLTGFATPGNFAFDQTHGFAIALTQGFFGPYFYINDARLSSVGEVLSSYTSPWQDVLPDWQNSDTAANRLLGNYSSGVFIPSDQVARLMTDAHGVQDLSDALAAEFPDEKLGVLWAALQTAHAQGAGLLEAAGAIVPDPHDLMNTTCFSRYEHCDPAGLQAYVERVARDGAPDVPEVPELPVPRHMQNNTAPHAGERLPSTPSLTERLREKRGEG